jgi:rhodanese-related sulfurtransferase
LSPAKLAQILVVAAALAGYSSWLRWARDGGPGESPAAKATGIELVRGEQAEALWRERSTVFLDVRPAEDYAYGHVAGAVHLPEEEFEARFPALEARLRRAGAIVVYCKSVDCGSSLWAAIRLRNAGLTQTRIYPAGWHDWQQRGLPSARSSAR